MPHHHETPLSRQPDHAVSPRKRANMANTPFQPFDSTNESCMYPNTDLPFTYDVDMWVPQHSPTLTASPFPQAYHQQPILGAQYDAAIDWNALPSDPRTFDQGLWQPSQPAYQHDYGYGTFSDFDGGWFGGQSALSALQPAVPGTIALSQLDLSSPLPANEGASWNIPGHGDAPGLDSQPLAQLVG